MDMNDKSKYILFDPYLQKISKGLTLKQTDKTKLTNALSEVFDELRKKLIEADPFLGLFKKTKFSGSYANGIKIDFPDEFDMMLCLKLPPELNVEVVNSQYPGYALLKTSGVKALKRKQNYEAYKCIEKWIDVDNFILQNKFREWLEGIIQKKVLNQLNRHKNQPLLECRNSSYILKFHKSNPAFTFGVQDVFDSEIKFDMDLVPNFLFTYSKTLPPIVKHKYLKSAISKDWSVIAKPVQNLDKNRHRCWHIVLCDQEKELLRDNANMKSILRFMKKLRDTQNMPYLKSYFINTMFMWEIEKQGTDFWKNSLSFLFMHMLYKMKDYLSNGNIPSFWCTGLNLLRKLNDHQLQDGVIKITNILKRIEANYPRNPRIICEILIPDSFNEHHTEDRIMCILI